MSPIWYFLKYRIDYVRYGLHFKRLTSVDCLIKLQAKKTRLTAGFFEIS